MADGVGSGSRRRRRSSEDGSSGHESEGSGEDLMSSRKGRLVAGSDDDSSEEEEDDPEEARAVAAGFIVDDEEDNEESGDDEKERKRKRKRRKAKRRRQMEEEEEGLDEDDLDLLAENSGVRRRKDVHRLKRFRRGSAEPADKADKPKDLSRIFDDDDEDTEMAPPRRTADYDEDDDDEELPSAANALRAAAADRSRRDMAAQQAGVGGFQDEMEDFIDDDDDDSDMSSVSDDEREARRERKRQERRAAQSSRRAGKAQAADPTRAGIDQEAWEELNDIFGNGDDYAWAFKKGDREELRDMEEDDAEDEEGAAEGRAGVQYKDIFEPAAIKARMLTDEDARIKLADIPERFQTMLPGSDGQKLLERKLDSDQLNSAARWICPRISTRCVRNFIQPDGQYVQLVSIWQSCVRKIVELVINEHREAMYLYVHHGDDIELRLPQDTATVKPVQLLNRRDLQGLVSACMRYKTLMARKEGLNNVFERLTETANVTSDQIKTFHDMMERAESTEEVADVSDWLGLAFGQRLRDVQAQAHEASTGEAGGEADEDGLVNGERVKGFKRPTNISSYEHLHVTMAKHFAGKAAMPSTKLAENYSASQCVNVFPTPKESPEELASQHTDSTLTSAKEVLEGAKRLCAEDIGRDPTIRREVRNLYRFFGLIDVVPTERGEGKIHDEHPYYNFKYLVGKPVPEFREETNEVPPPNPVQYLLMLEAEEQLLVNLDIQVMPAQLSGFERHLGNMYQGGESDEPDAELWAGFRSDVIKMALSMFLVPCGKAWVKEYLREECRDWLGRQCEQQLNRRIACRPYESQSMLARAANPQSKNSDMWTADDDDEDDEAAEDERRSWTVPKVLAVSHGLGNPNRDVTKAVFLDARGQLVQNASFDELSPPRRQIDEPKLNIDDPNVSSMSDRERETLNARLNFIDLLKRRRPDVVVINGFSPRTVGLRSLIGLMVERAVTDMVKEDKLQPEDDPRGDSEADQRAREERENERRQLHIDIIMVHDDLARIYQHSARAADEHPTLDVLSRYCVGLARYAQSPLQEFATLNEDDMASIRYHAQQHLLPKDRLITHLDNTLTAVVNDVTVDINRAVSDAYYAHQLKYVAGLGPRKAHALTRAITTHLEGTVVSRDSLHRGAEASRIAQKNIEILTPTIFHNAVAFLTIRGARRNALQGRPDVLDATRIHPESYEYAQFIAFDALRKTEEDREEGEHVSAFCRELLRDSHRHEKIRDIDLADYERLLLEQQHERSEPASRKLTLLGFIARELMEPTAENREDFVQPTEDEVFTALTGETSDTLLGILNVTVLNVQPEHIIVRLDSGIEGTINGAYLRPHDDGFYEQQGMRAPRLRDLVKQMQTIKAQVIAVDKMSLRVELTAKPEHLEAAAANCGKSGGVAVKPDARYYNGAAAQQATDKADTVRRRKTNMRNTRSIAHPNWKNFKAGQAEEYLAHAGLDIGSAVVRPSSNGNDHLAVTWKVAKGVYQHIDVLELDKENDYELGKSLRIGDMGTYSDLDELLVKHILPMAHMVQQLMQHEKYKESEEKLDQFLISYTQANPQRSIYGFAIDRTRAGYFSLAFKANRDAPIQRWPVKVLPNRYRLREADQLPDVAALCNSFKTQYVAEVTQRGGRTPGGIGGATPRAGLGTGMTPYGAGYGGATPGGGIGGATPGRYAAPGYGAGAATPGALRNPYAGMPGSVRVAQTGMTPNPYGQAGPSRTPNPYGAGAAPSGRTPNPYAQGRTPNPYASASYGAPAAYPGAPPAPPGAPPGPPPGVRYGGPPPPGAPPPPPPPGPPPSRPSGGPMIHPDRLARNTGGGGGGGW